MKRREEGKFDNGTCLAMLGSDANVLVFSGRSNYRTPSGACFQHLSASELALADAETS